jgi:hypothetical protein
VSRLLRANAIPSDDNRFIIAMEPNNPALYPIDVRDANGGTGKMTDFYFLLRLDRE